MPPVNPSQGSRVPLVAWTVASSILAVAMAVLAIYFYVDSDKNQRTLADNTAKFNDIITLDMVRSQGDELDKLRAAKTDPARGFDPSMKLFSVALAERNQLAKLIGNENDSAAFTAAKAAIDKAKSVAGVTGAEDLSGVVNALLVKFSDLKTEASNNKNDSDEARKKLQQTLDVTNGQIASIQKAMDQLRAERDTALDQVQKISKDQTQSFESTAADLRKQLDAVSGQLAQATSQSADLAAQIKTKDNFIAQLEDKLGEKRVDPSKAMLQHADGFVMALFRDNKCSITLGAGDHVTPGLTFEVYDRATGIPTSSDAGNDSGLPVGKASIEVDSVEPNYSFCHVTRLSPGAALTEGDIIANLVYDPNIKYRFVVHGNFDLDQSGKSSAADAEVIKRLITQWGGTIMNDINVDTDFVVLGSEPVVPDQPAPDAGPLEQAQYQEAFNAKRLYDEMRSKALAYRLPILNQNRFLYFIGFESQAKR